METNIVNNHSDGRSKNGGYRPGAGRPKGSGKSTTPKTVNKTIRMSDEAIELEKKAGIQPRQHAKVILAAYVKELKRMTTPNKPQTKKPKAGK